MVNSVIFLSVIYNAHALLKPIFGPFKEPKRSLRVYGGVVDHKDEYPYVVALGVILGPKEQKLKFDVSAEGKGPTFLRTCSGSLLSPRWVLSAEHCVGNGGPDGSPTHIRYGKTTIPPNDTSFSYSRVFKRISHVNADIGLILLQEQDKVTLPTYGILSTVDYMALAGFTVKYVGYGVTEIPPIPIREEEVKFAIKHQTKNRRIGKALVLPCSVYKTSPSERNFWKRLTFTMPKLCIVPTCSQRFAAGLHGDSGGPILRLGRIVAVFATWMRETQPTNSVTPVSPYIDWILSVRASNQ